MWIAAVILGLLVVGAFIGTAINFGSAFLGIPLVFLFIGAVIGKETMERQSRIMKMKRFRKGAQAQKVDFTADDKRTMI
jgi:hypothetical protein